MASKIFSLPKPTSLVPLLLLLLPLFSLAALASPNRQTTSSFEFLSKLQGFKKGDSAQEISQLRKYLNQFGYLNNNTHTQDVNVFDENISIAIKTYQTFYNLKPSGTLDAETVSKMMAPRCGVPDIQMHQATGNNNNTHLEYTFFPNNPKWPPSKFSLTYSFPPKEIFFKSYAMAPIASAFEKWRSVVPNFTFTPIKDFGKADIKISFQRRDHGDGHPFDGPRGVLAHAYAPTDGRLHFDIEENWVVGAVGGGFDIGTVALHEIGHILGLGHSPIKDAIMYTWTLPGMTKGLSDDDRLGLMALYS